MNHSPLTLPLRNCLESSMPLGWMVKGAVFKLKETWEVSMDPSHSIYLQYQQPYRIHVYMAYLPTFGWLFMVNVGKYTIHGSYYDRGRPNMCCCFGVFSCLLYNDVYLTRDSLTAMKSNSTLPNIFGEGPIFWSLNHQVLLPSLDNGNLRGPSPQCHLSPKK